MKQLTILTYHYSTFLSNFVAHTGTGELLVRRGGLTLVKCVNFANATFCERLLELMVDIALDENPLYQQSAKLRDLAGDLRATPVYGRLRSGLRQFLRHSQTLCLEGYLTFRMSEYREKLDMMSYSLIKKMKLTPQD